MEGRERGVGGGRKERREGRKEEGKEEGRRGGRDGGDGEEEGILQGRNPSRKGYITRSLRKGQSVGSQT